MFGEIAVIESIACRSRPRCVALLWRTRSIVVIPAEALDEHGLEPEFAELLITDGRLSAEQIDCLERGTALYWQRCRDLFARAPGSWFPPRQTNLLIISEQRGIFPYMEPFIGTSSLLYASDLNTHPEYVAYMLVHVDRLALLPSVRAALVCNLSYWFDRDDASRSAFASAAARAKRPDARCFTALANAFDWIDQLLHIPLREPQAGPNRALPGTWREPICTCRSACSRRSPRSATPVITPLAMLCKSRRRLPCPHARAPSMRCAIGCSKRVPM